ncbi:MAG TPA: hypothetical protein PKK10_12300 [Woeseiaceae bacterium]|nr:hypothetical protein [Woeseiaceae bacterium]
MKQAILISLVVVLVKMPSATVSGLPEFLIAVPAAEEQQVAAANADELKRQVYFAQRYRLVLVDVGVLRHAKEFRVSFFDDSYVNVVRRDLKHEKDSPGLIWTGSMLDQPVSRADLTAQGLSPQFADETYNLLVGVSIFGTKYVYDPTSGRSVSMAGLDATTMRPLGDRVDTKGKYEFFALAADFSLESLESTFRLMPLASDRRYHLLLELDTDKLISPARFGGPKSESERIIRRHLYERYLESQGIDPEPDLE